MCVCYHVRMISYELARELKVVGFPQKGNGETRSEDGRPKDWGVFDDFVEYVYYPTLSELIEAIGDGYFTLEHCGKDDWRCWRGLEPKPQMFGIGTTAEEAVARLYLALHKKV